MALAIRTATRIQDQDDVNVAVGPGVDGYALTWDNATSRFVLAAGAAGSGTAGRVAQWAAGGVTLEDANLIAPANVLTLAAAGAYTLTVPATGTAALLATANVFTAAQTVQVAAGTALTLQGSGNTIATSALIVKNSDNLQLVNVTNGSVVNFGGVTVPQYFMNLYSSARADLRIYSNGVSNFYMGFYVFGGAAGSAYGEFGFISQGTNQVASINFDSRAGVAPFRFFVRPSGGTSTDALDIFANTNVGIGTRNTDTGILFSVNSNDTAAGIKALMVATALGSGANGDGGAVYLRGKTSTTAAQEMARIAYLWNDATHASRKADLVFSAYDTAIREGVRIRGNGTEPALGFYGVAPVARQLLATGTGATVDNVITALQNLGLLKQA